MPTRIGKYTIQLQTNPSVLGFAAVVGKKESEGPYGKFYDQCHTDTSLGESSWEKAESRLQNEAVHLALNKAGPKSGDIDCIFAGRPFESVHLFYVRSAQSQHPVSRAVRRVFHHGADTRHRLAVRGIRRGGAGCGGHLLPFLFGGTAVPLPA